MAEAKDRPGAGPEEAERFVPGELGPFIEYEHAHRYGLAAQLVAGLRVLDLACGSGHGSGLLRSAGAEVVALDLDLACARLGRPSVQATAEAIPFGDDSFDAVVCFEAIEHVETPGTIVAEIARVLRRDGFALISTPDRRIYTDRAGNRNPYHLCEMDRAEFRELVGQHFRHAALYGQSIWAGSWIAALGTDAGTPRKGERKVRALDWPGGGAPVASTAPWVDPRESGFPTALYVIAVAAPRQPAFRRVQRQIGENSVLNDAYQRLLGESLAGQVEIMRRDGTIEELNLHARNLTARIEAAETDSRNVRDLLAKSEEQAERVGLHVENLEQELERRSAIAADLETHARNLETLLEGQSERVRELEKHVGNVENLLAQSREHAQNVETHAGNIETELAGRSTHAENLEQQIAGLQAHVDNLERQASEQREHAERVETHARNLEAELAGRSAHVEELEQQLAASSEHGAAVGAELEQTRQRLDQIRARRWYRILRALGASE